MRRSDELTQLLTLLEPQGVASEAQEKVRNWVVTRLQRHIVLQIIRQFLNDNRDSTS